MKFAVLFDEKLSLDDGYGDHYTKMVPSYKLFETQTDLMNWINYEARDKVYKVIEYNEIKVKVKLEIERPQVKRGINPKDEYERASIVEGSRIGPVSTRLVN